MPEQAVSAEERATVAREALREITPDPTVGALVSEVDEGEGVWTLEFAATMVGYPGWHWTVSVAEVDGAAPTVLEAELLPGNGALLAPEWVPWSERLEEYRAHQAALAAEAGDDAEGDESVDGDADDDPDDEDSDDEDSDDEDSDDEDESDSDESDDDEDDDGLELGDDDDDDYGDDPDDGIDFESDDSASPELDDDESE